MRIALGLHSLQLGGSQINTVDFATELRRRGHEVLLWAIDEGSYKATIEPVAKEIGFDVHKLPAENRLRRQATHVSRLVDEFMADILHVHHEHHWLGPVATLAMLSRPGKGLVVTNWMMENTHYMPPHAVLIVGTEALGREASARRPGPVAVIEPPVNLERDVATAEAASSFRRRVGVDDSAVLIVLVSRVDRYMKLDAIELAIRAVEVLNSDIVHLAIVGDGDAIDDVAWMARAANRRLHRRAVHVTGALTDPRPAYAAADVVLGMGGSALRGLAFGKPVVVQGAGTFARTYRKESAPYFLEHGFFGTAEGDEAGAGLAAQMRELLDPELRRNLGDFGRQMIRRRYSLEVLTDRLEQVYADTLQHPSDWLTRWTDAAYVSAYDLVGRTLSPRSRSAIRQHIPGLRGGKQTAAA
ncbi:MAG: glycosyltransferase family 4 protein [Acidimicrobiaceae bacterium]|nr:glycosyltransferase family 4 protein [Acidimicrobiaceae bacterium]